MGTFALSKLPKLNDWYQAFEKELLNKTAYADMSTPVQLQYQMNKSSLWFILCALPAIIACSYFQPKEIAYIVFIIHLFVLSPLVFGAWYLAHKETARGVLYSISLLMMGALLTWTSTVWFAVQYEISYSYYIILPVLALVFFHATCVFFIFPVITSIIFGISFLIILLFPLVIDPHARSSWGSFLTYSIISYTAMGTAANIRILINKLNASFFKSQQRQKEVKRTHSLLQIALSQTFVGLICFDPDGKEIAQIGKILSPNSSKGEGICKAQFEGFLEKQFGLKIEVLYQTPTLINDNEEYYMIEVRDLPNMRVFTFADVTKQQKQEKQIRSTQKLSLIGQLTSGIAHDYNNILAVAMSNIEAFPHHKNSDLWDGYIAPALRALQQAKSVSRKLLTLAGHNELQLKRTHVKTNISEMSPIILAALGANVSLEIDEHIEGVIDVDTHELEAAILNIALNAKNAIGSDNGRVKIYTETTNDHVIICIENNGPIIPKEHLDSIFDPFFTTRKDTHSTGLGLSMVRGLVEQLDGKIEVTSKKRETIFRLIFKKSKPLKRTKMGTSDTIKKKLNTHHRLKGEILMVDDNIELLNSMSRLLSLHDVRCHIASTRKEAIRLVKSVNKLKFALLDLSMPEISGLDLGKELLSLRPDLHYYILTGEASLDVQKKVKELGFKGLFFKPVNIDELLGRLLSKECSSV